MKKAKISKAQHAENKAALAELQDSIDTSNRFDVAMPTSNMTAKVLLFDHQLTLTIGQIAAALEVCVRAVESGEIELY